MYPTGETTKLGGALRRWSALVNERSSWMTGWQEISRFLLPRAGRFFETDRNRGDNRYGNILDNHASRALRTLAAGLMAGMTSPARPWFRLTTADPDLAEYAPVKTWLNDVTVLMRDIFARSNTYRALHGLYKELGAFGTGASLILADFDDVICHYPLTIGEYCIATDYKGRVNTIYRRFQKTVAQVVAEFGRENCSQTVRNLFDHGKGLDQWVTIQHVIEPRTDREYGKRDARNMPWKSCYFEIGSNEDKYLRESGFEDFVGLVPRWDVTGSDVYGDGPGFEALGDIKQLQLEQLRKAQGMDYQVNPPIQVPTSLKDTGDWAPGGVSFYDASQPTAGIRRAFEVDVDLSHLLADIQDVRARLDSAFYSDLFLMIANDRRNQRATATEIAEAHEEKLIMLGPVLERLHNELLSPKIDITFAHMVRSGILPEPPEEMHGQDLNIEFVSMLAQAQRAVGLASVDRLVGTIGQIAAAKQDPSLWDKIDTDELVDKYADMLGVDPSLIVADDRVAIVRESRRQAQQAAEQQAMAAQAAAMAKDLAAADTSGQNALTDLTQPFSGYS